MIAIGLRTPKLITAPTRYREHGCSRGRAAYRLAGDQRGHASPACPRSAAPAVPRGAPSQLRRGERTRREARVRGLAANSVKGSASGAFASAASGRQQAAAFSIGSELGLL
jgi:hypothetical protein